MSTLIGIYKDLEENEKMLEAFPEVVRIKLGQDAPGYDKKSIEKGSL